MLETNLSQFTLFSVKFMPVSLILAKTYVSLKKELLRRTFNKIGYLFN